MFVEGSLCRSLLGHAVVVKRCLVTAMSSDLRLTQVAMCPPKHFAVKYKINPWMGGTVDRALAQHQWDNLKVGHHLFNYYLRLAKTVKTTLFEQLSQNGALEYLAYNFVEYTTYQKLV